MTLLWWHQLTDPRRGGRLEPDTPYIVLLGRFPCTHWQGNALEPHPDNRDHVICRMCGEILDVIAGHDPRSTLGAATQRSIMRRILTGALGLMLAGSVLSGCAPASGQPDGETGTPAASSGHAAPAVDLRVAPAAAVIPASADAAPGVVPYSVVNVTCPNYIGGGGGCQAVVLDRTVPGATGTLHVVVYYNWLADHSKYNIYDEVIQNHTSRTQFLAETEISNSCCTVESHTYSGELTVAINGTYDQHVAPGGSSFLGKYLPTGQGYRGFFYMKNSGTSVYFYVSSDTLP